MKLTAHFSLCDIFIYCIWWCVCSCSFAITRPQAFIYGLFAVLIIIATEIVALSIIIIYCKPLGYGPYNKSPHYSHHYWSEYWIFRRWPNTSNNNMCVSVYLALSRATHTTIHINSVLLLFFYSFQLTFLSHVHNRLISNWQFIAPIDGSGPGPTHSKRYTAIAFHVRRTTQLINSLHIVYCILRWSNTERKSIGLEFVIQINWYWEWGFWHSKTNWSKMTGFWVDHFCCVWDSYFLRQSSKND